MLLERLRILQPESKEELATAAKEVEAGLRKRFLDEATVTNYEKGYISVPFVNQLVDMETLEGSAFLIAYHYQQKGVHFDKVVGIPNSGTPLAAMVAHYMGKPLALGRKGNSTPGSWKTPIRVTDDVPSFTTGETSEFVFNGLSAGDWALMVDDVTAKGDTGKLIGETFRQHGIEQMGLAVNFSKLFQGGVAKIENELGIETFSVIEVESISLNGDINLAPPHFG